ncbi:MAG: enoyl-CoA hydratase/isomerase family protein [Actinobacteria bacterium]|nr:enoyl-CoA hydratase/isomerase family protein [Actinomycetota bacterium]
MTQAKESKPKTPDDQLCLIEDHGDWALLTINRPEKRNAMSRAAMEALQNALRATYDKKVIVLTGVGPSFCAGVDLVEHPDDAPEGERHRSRRKSPWQQVNEELRRHPAIFIAAVNGFALGGGSTLVHNCDLAIAAESAGIGAPELSFGGWPSLAGPAAIKRLMPKHAAQMILTARRWSGQEAYRIGLVNDVVPDDQLLTKAAELAEHIAAFDATVLDYAKQMIQKMQELSWEDAMELSDMVGPAITAKRTTPNDGLARFAAGERTSVQGANG